VPHFEAAAATGRGVYETLHAVSRLLFQRLRSEFGRHAGSSRSGEALSVASGSRPTSGVMQAPTVRPTSGVMQAPRPAAPSGIRQTPPGLSGPSSVSGMPRPSQVMESPVDPAKPAVPEDEGAPQEYGRTIELSDDLAARPPSMEGFIRDPMRRREGSEDGKAAPTTPVRQVRVPVVLKSSDLKPGAPLHIVLEIRVEP